MKKQVWQDFMNYIDKIENLSEEQYNTLFQLFDRFINDSTAENLKVAIDEYSNQNVYSYFLLKETLLDVINGSYVKEEEKAENVEDIEEEAEEDIEEEVEEDIEDIKENDVEEEKKQKEIGSFKKFYLNHMKKYDKVDGQLDPIYIEEKPMNKEIDIVEDSKEDIEEPEQVVENIENVEEEKEETKEKKIGPFKKFYYKHIKKYKNIDGQLDPIYIEETEPKQASGLRRLFKKIKDKYVAKKEESNFKFIKRHVKDIYGYNDEILDFMDLLEEREDRKEIVDELDNYFSHSKYNPTEEEFLDKLYEIFGISKKEDNQKELISEDNQKELINDKKIVKTEVKEKTKRDISKLNSKYYELKKDLTKEFEKEEMFVEDAYSEGLEIGDQEYDQMAAERCIDKTRVYRYLLELEKIKLLSIYDNLNQYEKAFIKDAYSEGLEIGDQEYDQMAAERGIDKEVILQFHNVITESKKYQDKLVENCKIETLKFNGINFNDKKVDELKQIAKNNNVNGTSKMKKEQLINILNQLKEAKEQELNKRLGLIK